jgi:hypothetical protein
LRPRFHQQPSGISTSWTADITGCEASSRSSEKLAPDIQAMSEALDLAWTALRTANHACATGRLQAGTRHQLALAIVESARRGTRDGVGLSKSALRSFFPIGLDGEAGDPMNEERDMGVCVINSWLSPKPGVHDRDEWIRARAQDLWKRSGGSGQPQDYCFQAEIEFEMDHASPEGSSSSNHVTPLQTGVPGTDSGDASNS